MNGKRALALATSACVLTGVHCAMTPMAWLDSAHVAMRYARRISDEGTIRLLGQSSPVEAFSDPLWTVLLSVLGSLGVHELKVQPFLGPGLCALVVGLSVCWVARDRPSLTGGLFTALLATSPVLTMAARSGSDDLFVSLLMLTSAWGCMRHARWVMVPLVGLALAGVLPLIMAIGLAAWHSRRALIWVVGAVVALTVIRLATFGTLLPHAGLRMLLGGELSSLASAVQLVPVSLGIALIGFAGLWRSNEAVWPLAWPVGVGVIGAGLLTPDSHDFAASLVPILPLLFVSAALGISRMPRPVVMLSLAGLAVVAGDHRLAFDARPEVVAARQSDRQQAQTMAKFLRWRFAQGATVVVQTPGMLPYFLRMPTVDLQGLAHGGPTDQESMQALDPEVMIPMGQMVSKQPTRLSMSDDWDWKSLADTHVQHAIMQSRDWEVVPIHPIWFNFYMRDSLPKYPPKWVEIYAREEAARAEAKKRAEDEASAR